MEAGGDPANRSRRAISSRCSRKRYQGRAENPAAASCARWSRAPDQHDAVRGFRHRLQAKRLGRSEDRLGGGHPADFPEEKSYGFGTVFLHHNGVAQGVKDPRPRRVLRHKEFRAALPADFPLYMPAVRVAAAGVPIDKLFRRRRSRFKKLNEIRKGRRSVVEGRAQPPHSEENGCSTRSAGRPRWSAIRLRPDFAVAADRLHRIGQGSSPENKAAGTSSTTRCPCRKPAKAAEVISYHRPSPNSIAAAQGQLWQFPTSKQNKDVSTSRMPNGGRQRRGCEQKWSVQ